jgi:aspartyl-tRNA(Asn)/glutamyl-tRNA(Gln) amidotransferase subunit C
MKLTLDEVEHIATLARLNLTEAEKEQYCHQLSAILEYAARLQSLDTSGIPPTSSVLPEHAALREDAVGKSLPVETTLANAPEKEKNQFRVPPVLE